MMRKNYVLFSWGYSRSLATSYLSCLSQSNGPQGFVAGMIHHMRSLRRMVHCNWIKPVMDEAENERMHLMTFMELSNQRWHQRVIVVCGQGVFFAAYTLFYVLTPRIAHRFVGYLEEEAVHTYTEMLKMVDAGKIKNVPAPEIASKYWNMPKDATLRDVILVVASSVC